MKRYIVFLIVLLIAPLSLMAQNEDNYSKVNPFVKTTSRFARDAFGSSALVDNQTDRIYRKGTFEFEMNHRFGLVNNDPVDFDLFGIYGLANIRLGLRYALTDWATFGYGFTKDLRLNDFNYKFSLLKQTRDNKFPVNISLYGNVTSDARDKSNFQHTTDRYTFFNQIIISKRFSRNFSALIRSSVSHFNIVDSGLDNDVYAVGFGTRYKLTPTLGIMAEYTEPFTNDSAIQSGVSFGLEIETAGHAFQVFISNYRSIVPQYNTVRNTNNFFDGDFAIGFNITRLWDFSIF